MVIYEYPKERRIKEKCVLALGFFDGVHIAHRDLILTAKEVAEKKGLPLGIFTFGGEIKAEAQRIYSDGERAEIFEALGASFTVIYDFSKIKDTSPEDFVKTILIEELDCVAAIAGFNFRFGKGAAGDAEMLSALMRKAGGEAVIREEITSRDGETISSTRIRELLVRGEMSSVQELLGAPYYIKGSVERGRGVGRTLGNPTVNIDFAKDKIIPRHGVYRAVALIGGKAYSAVTNVGVCPTFKERPAHSETHVLGLDGEIYGEKIKVLLLEFMRDEIAFSSPEELKMQINIDKNYAIKANGDIKWQEFGLK